jgi:hypothetical protein
MMYVWNGFPIVSKRKDLSENLLVTVEKVEAALQNESKCEKRWVVIFVLSSPFLSYAHLSLSVCVHPAKKLEWD